MKDDMHAQYPKLPLDSEMIVFEGCENDDSSVLGGKNAFLSHFCTLFTFNICHGPGDTKMLKRNIALYNNPNKLDSFLKSFDEKEEKYL